MSSRELKCRWIPREDNPASVKIIRFYEVQKCSCFIWSPHLKSVKLMASPHSLISPSSLGGLHKWVLNSLSEEAKRVRQAREVAGGGRGGRHKASYDE